MTAEFGFQGSQTPGDNLGQFNAQQFMVTQLINKLHTNAIVKVVSVTNDGGLSPTGTVNVQPLVNQIDGYGNGTPHGVIVQLPYFRLQGGANAVIIDPQVGDIGLAMFCERDIANVAITRKQANPGSLRKYSMSDGLYLGGFLNGTPTQYVRFSSAGIDIHSPTEINISAPVVRVHASTSLHVDCDGNGFVYTSSNRDDYVTGSTGSAHSLNPPQVP